MTTLYFSANINFIKDYFGIANKKTNILTNYYQFNSSHISLTTFIFFIIRPRSTEHFIKFECASTSLYNLTSELQYDTENLIPCCAKKTPVFPFFLSFLNG